MERFKRLSLKKNNKKKYKVFERYQVEIDNNDLVYLQHLDISNIKKIENKIIFCCSLKTIKILEKQNISFQKIDLLKEGINRKSLLKKVSIFFLLIIIGLFFLNQLFIREIAFIDKNYTDIEVYDYVKGYTKKFGPYLKLDKNVQDISQELRTKFYYYGYIGVYKKGAKLLIEIKNQDVNEEKSNSIEQIGEYIATCNGRIDCIKITSGVVVMPIETIVKKGDVIVTSNINYQDNLYNKDLLIPLVGKVFGTTYHYSEIRIPKVEKIKLHTNNYQKSYQLLVGEKQLGKIKNEYIFYSVKGNNLLNLFNRIKVIETIVYETKYQEIIHSKEEATKISKIKIHQDFEKKRVDDSEKIVSIKLIEYSETDNEYIFYYLINNYENIVEFRPFVSASK